MAIDWSNLLKLRPHAFHTTGATNLEAIRHDGAMVSAWNLLNGTPHEELLSAFRKRSCVVNVHGRPRLIRDQKPIRPRSLNLEPGTTMAQYRDSINQRVFFWPGRGNWVVAPGRSHHNLYARCSEPLFVLRVPLASLLHHNSCITMFVSRCNSGSARHHGGQPAVRGPSTFRRLHEADFRASEVVEISFLNGVNLPPDTQFAPSLNAQWQSL